MPRPMPRLAPVINATLSLSLTRCLLSNDMPVLAVQFGRFRINHVTDSCKASNEL